MGLIHLLVTSLVAQMVKCLPTMWETWFQTLGQEDLLEKEMVTHSSILVWKIPWMEEPDRLQSMGSRESDKTEQLHFINLLKFSINDSRIPCPIHGKKKKKKKVSMPIFFFLCLAVDIHAIIAEQSQFEYFSAFFFVV